MTETVEEIPRKKMRSNEKLLTNEDNDVLDLFGLDIASKLRKMGEEERGETISLISNIITNKLSNKPTVNNQSVDTMCSEIVSERKINSKNSDDSSNMESKQNLSMNVEMSQQSCQNLENINDGTNRVHEHESEINPISDSDKDYLCDVKNENDIEPHNNVSMSTDCPNEINAGLVKREIDDTYTLTDSSDEVDAEFINLIDSSIWSHTPVSDSIYAESENDEHDLLEPEADVPSCELENIFIHEHNTQLCPYSNGGSSHAIKNYISHIDAESDLGSDTE